MFAGRAQTNPAHLPWMTLLTSISYIDTHGCACHTVLIIMVVVDNNVWIPHPTPLNHSALVLLLGVLYLHLHGLIIKSKFIPLVCERSRATRAIRAGGRMAARARGDGICGLLRSSGRLLTDSTGQAGRTSGSSRSSASRRRCALVATKANPLRAGASGLPVEDAVAPSRPGFLAVRQLLRLTAELSAVRTFTYLRRVLTADSR